MILEYHLLVEEGRLRQDVGCTSGIGQADEWDLGDEGVLSHRQDKPEVAVLAPAVGILNLRHACG